MHYPLLIVKNNLLSRGRTLNLAFKTLLVIRGARFIGTQTGVAMSLACQKGYCEDFDLRAVGDRWSNTLAMTRVPQANEAEE